MNSQQDDVIYGLMNELEEVLEKNGMPLLGSFSVVKKDTVTNILDRLYAALPDEIKEARREHAKKMAATEKERAEAARQKRIAT